MDFIRVEIYLSSENWIIIWMENGFILLWVWGRKKDCFQVSLTLDKIIWHVTSTVCGTVSWKALFRYYPNRQEVQGTGQMERKGTEKSHKVHLPSSIFPTGFKKAHLLLSLRRWVAITLPSLLVSWAACPESETQWFAESERFIFIVALLFSFPCGNRVYLEVSPAKLQFRCYLV